MCVCCGNLENEWAEAVVRKTGVIGGMKSCDASSSAALGGEDLTCTVRPCWADCTDAGGLSIFVDLWSLRLCPCGVGL